MQVERYKERHGHYPASVHADKIYRTRKNRAFCVQLGSRLSGLALGLGLPAQATADNAVQLKALKRQQHQDEIDRIAIEGKFGQGKRRFTLARIMAKLADTAATVIMVAFMVMNLGKILADLLLSLFWAWGLVRRTAYGVYTGFQAGLSMRRQVWRMDLRRGGALCGG